MIKNLHKELSFLELVEARKAKGHEEYGVELDIGVIVDSAFYMDISWECMEEIADAVVYLEFEQQKLANWDSKQEIKRLGSLIKSLASIAHSLEQYRERISVKYPELLEETLEDEIRAGHIRKVRSS